MPVIAPVQHGFQSGELSPWMLSRYDMEQYHFGAAELTNFVPVKQGPALRRYGFDYITEYDGIYGRLFPFIVSSAVNYSIVATVDKIYVNDSGGVIGDVNLFGRDGDFLDGQGAWTFEAPGAADVIFSVGSATLIPTAGQHALIRYKLDVVPLEDHQITVLLEQGVHDPTTIRMGISAGDNSLFESTVVNQKSVIATVQSSTAELWVEVWRGPGTDALLVDKTTAYQLSTVAAVEFDSPYLEDDLRNLQVAYEPNTDTVRLFTPRIAPQIITYDGEADVWSFAPIDFTVDGAVMPPEWGATNWPACGAFFRGRLWVGGTLAEPETLWASAVGKPNDFTIPATDPTAADGFKMTIYNKGQVVWLAASRSLVVGTRLGEYILTSEGVSPTPGDANIEQQSAYGSRRVQATRAGNQILYTSGDGKKLREMGYRWTDEGWTSQDLTYFAEHITGSGRRIREIHYLLNPYNIVAAVTDEGTLLFCTYDRQTSTMAWCTAPTQGKVVSAAVGSLQGQSFLWLLINRQLEGNPNKLFLERAHYTINVDSAVVKSYPAPSATMDGLDHLIGETVKVVADGALQPDQVVQAGGLIPLDPVATNVTAGLFYPAKLVTMPIDKGQPMGGSMHYMKQWASIYVRVLNSYRPLINGQRAPDRDPVSKMNLSQPPLTEDIRIHDLGHRHASAITIECDLPLPCTVSGIFGEMKQSGMSNRTRTR